MKNIGRMKICALAVSLAFMAGAFGAAGGKIPKNTKEGHNTKAHTVSVSRYIPSTAGPFSATEILGRPTDTSVTVNALAGTNLDAYYEYGVESGIYIHQTSTTAFAAGHPTEVVIDSLSPNTRYYYRIRYRETGETEFSAGDEHTFHTQRVPGSTFTFTVVADSHLGTPNHCNPDLYARTMLNALEDNPDFHIDLGDTFRSSKVSDPDYASIEQLYINQRDYFGLVCHSAPAFLVIGNHEMELGWELDGTAENLAIWSTTARKRFYSNPVPDEFYTGSETVEDFVGLCENYYGWEWGDALFVTLDPFRYTTTDPKSTGDNWDWTLGNAQYQWLKTTLEESDAKFKFIFSHHVIGTTRGGTEWADLYEQGGRNRDDIWEFDTRRPGWTSPIHQLMAENDVSVFFQGHDHIFVKQELDDVVYLTCPMPGDRHYPDDPENMAYNNWDAFTGEKRANSGHIRVTVAPSGVAVDYLYAFLPEDENATYSNRDVAYSFSIASPVKETPFGGTMVLGRPTDTSIALNVLADADTEVRVSYGVTPSIYSAHTGITSFTGGTPAEIEIGPLQPDTRYYYRLEHRAPGETEFDQTEEYTFHTQRPPGSTFTFTVQSDSHLGEVNSDEELYGIVLENVREDEPDFHLDLGDTFMMEKFATTYEETAQCCADHRPFFGIPGPSAPIFLCNGNHEGELGWKRDGTADNIAIWSTLLRRLYYSSPVSGGFYSGAVIDEDYVGPRDSYYAWEWGSALFIVLDPFWYTTTKPSQSGDNWDWTIGEEQYQWFKQTLEESGALFRFVFIHNLVGGVSTEGRGGIEGAPYYEWGGKNGDGSWGFDSERPGWELPLHQLMVEHNVSIVFHGHDHLFIKQDLDGIVYQLVPRPTYTAYDNITNADKYSYTHGVVIGCSGHIRVTVGAAQANVEYVRAYRPVDETLEQVNREVAYSYFIGAETSRVASSWIRY